MNSAGKRLQELLDGILDGSCTDAQQQELAELVDNHHQLTAELVEQLRLHSLLQWQCGAGKSTTFRKPESGIIKMPESNHSSTGFPGIFKFSAIRWRWAAAALLLVAAGLTGWYGLHLGADANREVANPVTGNRGVMAQSGNVGSTKDKTAAVAEVYDNHSVVWSGSNTALLGNGSIVAGRLEMKSGVLTLKFRSGATMTANGDCSMRIVSDMLVLLDRGKATAHVPQWAKGFTIKTKDVEVVDLGTQFGVMAREQGATDVVVFEGQVDYKPTVGPEASSEKRLTQGQGVRVNDQGGVDRIVELRRDGAQGQWTTDEMDFGQPDWTDTPFKSIRDNIPSVDIPTYYQITPRGLEDDARAYVDAPHEWNGLTSDGLPEFLLDADYVMTRNDYRYINEFEMTVELAHPAMVYVFFDRRVPPPQWLTDQFENTGVDIGLDEGPWNPGDTKHTLGVGGGESIDNVFTVWSKRCEKPETLKFGSMGKKPGARAMYGIAAKSL
jgi:hypothetical protein